MRTEIVREKCFGWEMEVSATGPGSLPASLPAACPRPARRVKGFSYVMFNRAPSKRTACLRSRPIVFEIDLLFLPRLVGFRKLSTQNSWRLHPMQPTWQRRNAGCLSSSIVKSSLRMCASSVLIILIYAIQFFIIIHRILIYTVIF